jgi:hypothetical protein
MQRSIETKRLSSGSTSYAVGVGLLIAGLLVVAFCGLSLLVGRRLPQPIAGELIAASALNWLGVVTGLVLLASGAVLAIMSDFKASRAAFQPDASHSAHRNGSPGLARAQEGGGVEQQPDRVNVHRRIPVPRTPVKKL